MRHRTLLPLLAVPALTAVAAATAHGAAWLPAETVSREPYYYEYWLHLGPAFLSDAGVAHSYWETVSVGSEDSRMAVRPAHGPWRAAEPPPVAAPSGPVHYPTQTLMGLTQSAGGTLHAVSFGSSRLPSGAGGGSWVVRAARSTPAGSWALEGSSYCVMPPIAGACLDQAQDPEDPDLLSPYGPAFATTADGRGAAAWSWSTATTGRVMAATRTASGYWSVAAPVAESADARLIDPAVAVDAAGDVAVAWVAETATGRALVVRDRRGGAWSAPRTLDAGWANRPAMWANAGGWLVLAWVDRGSLSIARRSPNGTWRTFYDIAASDSYTPWLRVDQGGNALVLWQRGGDVVDAYLGATQTSVSSKTVARGATFEDAVMPAQGTTIVAVTRGDSVSVVRSGGGVWQAPQDIDTRASDEMNGVRIAADSRGNLLLVWGRTDGRWLFPPATVERTIRSAIYDQTPPVVQPVSGPASVPVDAPASFSATASDGLSAVQTPVWDMGDGATATAGTVSHRFRTAGVRTVTVRVRDAAGNEGVATRQVTVTNPVPALLSVAPQQVRAGADGAQLVLGGTGFVEGSQARWNGTPVPTSVEGPTLLTVQVPASMIAAPGTGTLTVANPAPGGGTSGARQVAVDAPAPVVPAPVNVVGPSVTGTAVPGVTLVCAAGQWSGSPDVYAFRWLRDGQPVEGLFAATYAVTAADVGRTLACRVTAANAGGASSALSPPLAVVAAPAPPAPPAPAVTAPPAGGSAGTPVVTPTVTVRPLRARVTAPRRVRRGRVIAVRVVLAPARRGVPVRLEARLGGRWLVVARTASRGAVVVLRTRALRAGATSFRVRWTDGTRPRTSPAFTVVAR